MLPDSNQEAQDSKRIGRGSIFHMLRPRYSPRRTPTPFSLRPQHYGIPLPSPFSWVGTFLAHTTQTTSGQGNRGSPSSTRGYNYNIFAYLFKLREKGLVKKAYAEIESKCTSSAFTFTFPMMTIMTDESPRQILPVACKRR